MNLTSKTAAIKPFTVIRQRLEDFKLLVKLRLTLTVVFSSVMAYLIAVPGNPNGMDILILSLGGFLVTAAANTLNQVLEKDYDKLMKRTANRPLATGRMKVADAVLAAGLMSLVGIILLALFNPWSAFFGMLALLSYAFLYTPLKRISPIAVLVGAFPGALPTLIGAAAAEGRVSALGMSLFAIQFFWQFPHFWSIGWLGYEDYKNAGYKLLPSRDGERDPNTGLQSFIYALFLVPIASLPYVLGFSGIVAEVVSVVLSLIYAALGWQLYRKNDRKSALQLMFFSFVYIPAILLVLFFDKM